MRAIAEYDNYISHDGLATVKRYLFSHWNYHRNDEKTKREMLARPLIYNQRFIKGVWVNVSYSELFINSKGMLSFTKTIRLD